MSKSNEHAKLSNTHGAPAFPSWSRPIAQMDAFITKAETKLLMLVLGGEISALVVWVLLKGFSTPAHEMRGRFLRAFFLSILFAALGAAIRKGLTPSQAQAGEAGLAGEARGGGSRLVIKKLPVMASAFGILIGLWVPGLFSNYAQNWLNWVQNASVLMLIGGLRGLVTRLTLWLALLGASLATASGKHINIDFVLRLADQKIRTRVALLGWLTASVMCITGAWGFVDQLALGEYRAPRTVVCESKGEGECETPPTEKLSVVAKEFGKDMFLLGRQASLDVQTLPVVLFGNPYDKWLSVNAWNEFASDKGFAEHYGEDKAKTLQRAKEQTDPVLPAVIVPGGEENIAGLLVRDLNLVIPMGLLMIGLRFLLRCLLVLSGRIIVDPNQVHGDGDDKHNDEFRADSEAVS
jgi:hypothetical protein